MFLFSTDIDGTVYDGPDTATAFARFWKSLPDRLPQPPVLAYNTGRSLPDTRKLVRITGLPEPDWYICDVGTTIFEPASGSALPGWRDHLSEGWDFKAAEELVASTTAAAPQPDECQGEFKSSWFWTGASAEEIDRLGRGLRDIGVDGQVVYSSSRDLDLLPARANKGNAIAFLAAALGRPLAEVIVAGDSGNDAAMYGVRDVRGVIVANAERRLRDMAFDAEIHYAKRPCAFGVIEGIEHFLNLAPEPPS